MWADWRKDTYLAVSFAYIELRDNDEPAFSIPCDIPGAYGAQHINIGGPVAYGFPSRMHRICYSELRSLRKVQDCNHCVRGCLRRVSPFSISISYYSIL